jgi:hypothetical protein
MPPFEVGFQQAMDIQLDLPLRLLALIDDDEVQVAVRPGLTPGP